MNPKPSQDKPAGKVKLTKVMKSVLHLMASGWELGSDTTSSGSAPWLQLGGIGRGGRTVNTNWNTVAGLLNRKLIRQHYKFPTATYSRTALGRRALKESSK